MQYFPTVVSAKSSTGFNTGRFDSVAVHSSNRNEQAVSSHTATNGCPKSTDRPVKNQQCHSWQPVCTPPTTIEHYKQYCSADTALTHTHTHTSAHLFAFPAAWHHHSGFLTPWADWSAVAELLIRSKDHKVVPRGDISMLSLAIGREMPGWL